jgi:hypothetical protein
MTEMISVGPTKNQRVICECEIFTAGGLEPTEKPERKPLSTVAVIILLKASMTLTKRKGDSGSSCLNPRELLKKPAEEPFTKIEKRTEDMQCAIQEHHFSLKPHLLIMYKRKFQLIPLYLGRSFGGLL